MRLLSGLLAWLATRALLMFAYGWTGVRPLWKGVVPSVKQRVYFANHGSHGDFVLIWASLPPDIRKITRPVAGQDYWLASRTRRFMADRVFRALLINRRPRPSEPSPIMQMSEALEAGNSIILFPEGTRNTTENALLPFKSGLFYLSRQATQVEFVPVWIDNIRRVIPKGEFIPVPMVCTVTFGAPLSLRADESRSDFLRRAEEAVLAQRPQESQPC